MCVTMVWCVCLYVCMYIYMHTYKHTYTYMYTYIHIYFVIISPPFFFVVLPFFLPCKHMQELKIFFLHRVRGPPRAPPVNALLKYFFFFVNT